MNRKLMLLYYFVCHSCIFLVLITISAKAHFAEQFHSESSLTQYLLSWSPCFGCPWDSDWIGKIYVVIFIEMKILKLKLLNKLLTCYKLVKLVIFYYRSDLNLTMSSTQKSHSTMCFNIGIVSVPLFSI